MESFSDNFIDQLVEISALRPRLRLILLQSWWSCDCKKSALLSRGPIPALRAYCRLPAKVSGRDFFSLSQSDLHCEPIRKGETLIHGWTDSPPTQSCWLSAHCLESSVSLWKFYQKRWCRSRRVSWCPVILFSLGSKVLKFAACFGFHDPLSQQLVIHFQKWFGDRPGENGWTVRFSRPIKTFMQRLILFKKIL